MRDRAGDELPLDEAHGRVRHVLRPSEQAKVVELFRFSDAESLVELLVINRECDGKFCALW
jgi:hypothetical protein